jgi:hypothetical protein
VDWPGLSITDDLGFVGRPRFLGFESPVVS